MYEVYLKKNETIVNIMRMLCWHWCDLAAKDGGLECTFVNNDDFTVLVSGGGRCRWGSMRTVWPSHPKWASRAMNLHQILCEAWIFLRGNYSDDSEGHSYGQLVIGSFIRQCACLCIMSHAEFFAETSNHPGDWVTQPAYSPDLAPCDFWLFPKLKSPLKGKRFQTINKIQENMRNS